MSSKIPLDKYEYLSCEDLGYKSNVFEKAKLEYSLLGMSISKELKKDEVKSVAKSKSDFSYDSNHTFFEFYKKIDQFKDMSINSNHTIMIKKSLKTLNQQNQKQLKKERIIKNVEEVYRKYFCKYSTKTSMTVVVS